jgi:hypothetical protein
MAHVQIDSTDPRITYVVGATSTTDFVVPFSFFATSDIKVYIDGVLQVETTDYTVDGDAVDSGFSGGTVELVDAVTNVEVEVRRQIDIERTTDFPNSGPMPFAALNTDLDRLIAICQELQAQIDEDIATAISGTGNVPGPVLADVGAPLVATGAGAFGWGNNADFRVWAEPATGRHCVLEEFGIYTNPVAGAGHENAAANVTAWNTIMSNATGGDIFTYHGYMPFSSGITLANHTEFRSRWGRGGNIDAGGTAATGTGPSGIVLTQPMSPGTIFLNSGHGTLIENHFFYSANGVFGGIACGHIATGGDPALEHNIFRNINFIALGSGEWFGCLVVDGEDGPPAYGSRSVEIHHCIATSYSVYGMKLAGVAALKGINIDLVQPGVPPSVADLWIRGSISNAAYQFNISASSIDTALLEGNVVTATLHCGVIGAITLDVNTNSLFITSGSIGTVTDLGTNNTILSGGDELLSYNKLKLLGARKTGWTPWTGTANRATHATYTSPNISAGYVEAEVQAIADGLQDVSRGLKALIDDLHATAGHGLIGT